MRKTKKGRPNQKNKQAVIVAIKCLLLAVFIGVFHFVYFRYPCDGKIDFTNFLISDSACLLTALGIEVSFVTYIEQTVYNRSFRHDVLKRLTFNTVIDCVSLTLLYA
jgi:hypothetical protein